MHANSLIALVLIATTACDSSQEPLVMELRSPESSDLQSGILVAYETPERGFMVTIGLMAGANQDYLATVDYLHACRIENIDRDDVEMPAIQFSPVPCDVIAGTVGVGRKVAFDWSFVVHHEESGRSYLELDTSQTDPM